MSDAEDKRIAEIKEIAKKSLGYIGQLNKVVKSQADTIASLTKRLDSLEESGVQTNKPRSIRADPEAIAFAAYLLNSEDFTLKEVEDAGALSYNRTYGLSQWSDSHLQKFLEDKEVTELYEKGVEHELFAQYVPNYKPKM